MSGGHDDHGAAASPGGPSIKVVGGNVFWWTGLALLAVIWIAGIKGCNSHQAEKAAAQAAATPTVVYAQETQPASTTNPSQHLINGMDNPAVAAVVNGVKKIAGVAGDEDTDTRSKIGDPCSPFNNAQTTCDITAANGSRWIGQVNNTPEQQNFCWKPDLSQFAEIDYLDASGKHVFDPNGPKPTGIIAYKFKPKHDLTLIYYNGDENCLITNH